MAETGKIIIPVEFRETANSYRSVIQQLESELKKIKPGTAIYDSIVNQLKNAKKAMGKLDLDIDAGILKRSDIDKIERDFISLSGVLERIKDSFGDIDLGDLNINTTNFGDLSKNLLDAQRRLEGFQKKAQEIKGKSIKDLLSDTDGLSLFSGKEIEKSGYAVFQDLNKQIGQVAHDLKNATDRAEEFKKKISELNQEKSQLNVKSEEQKTASLYYGITGSTRSKVGESKAHLTEHISSLMDTNTGEWLSSENASAAEAVLDAFGLDTELVRVEASKRLEEIKAAIEKLTGKQINDVRQRYRDTANAKVDTSEIDKKIADATRELQRAESAQKDYGSYDSETGEARGQLGALYKKVTALSDAITKSGNGETLSSLDAQIEAVEKEIDNIWRQIGQKAPSVENLPTEPPSLQNVYESFDANKESQQFTENLKKTISHWMSAQQVINMVKDGIRQAYQDIKGLDTAMTNIAVVTDMSVSDLWGKINDYMSIAQQYGVTTQGVYEVSQLYYQQGLSTNEVMAATTETLKMARIAGMDYKDAADAMTVAIRAFKMEMSDAGHVTDVYSKVAAVTASDTEELAIAMSKTASSAESVGSSFENTTAMLAVMIETTRESAQNLGSALKSIISRYGEMKQGLTQDSDGEIIDYNKTDAALRSIGISIKDAQGQFRDFDDVIFELSAKWDSLDKNTQRYIATIMAGNRQQSRFIALVDNWERLDEVATSAQDSEDAGLLQYAKTLDSLDTKLNNLKTSFQSFYMSIFNGEFFKGAADLANNLVQSFSRLGPILGGINLLQLINQIKLVGQLLINSFSGAIQKIQKSRNEWQKEFTNGWEPVGERIANIIAAAIRNGAKEGANDAKNEAQNVAQQKQIQPLSPTSEEYKKDKNIWTKARNQLNFSPLLASGIFAGNNRLMEGALKALPEGGIKELQDSYESAARKIKEAGDTFGESAKRWADRVIEAGKTAGDFIETGAEQDYRKELAAADIEAQKEIASAEKAKAAQNKYKLGQAAYTVGTLATSAGMMMDQSTMAGYDWSTGLQAAGGAATAVGQFITGDVVGSVITAITTASSVIKRIVDRDKVELENLEKAAEEANVKRAEAKNDAQNLEQTINNLKRLEEARYDSEEANQAFLDASKAAAEAFPELAQKMDESGQMIVDVSSNATNAERLLYEARQKSAEAAIAASAAELEANAKKSENARSELEKYSATQALGEIYTSTTSYSRANSGNITGMAGMERLSSPLLLLTNLFGKEFANSVPNINSETGKIWQGDELLRGLMTSFNLSGVLNEAHQAPTDIDQSLLWLIKSIQDPSSAIYQYAASTNEGIEYYQELLLNRLKDTGAIKADATSLDSFIADYNNAVQASLDADLTTQASLRAAVIAEAEADYLSLERNAPNEWINEVSTSRNMMWNMIWDTADIDLTNTDYVKNNKLTELAKTQIENTTKDIEALWDDYYGTNLANIDELNEIITASIKGTMSAGDAATEFKRLSAGGGTQGVEAAYIKSFYENDARYRAMYLRGAGATVKQGYGSLEEYRKLEGKVNNGADQYLEDLRNNVEGIDDKRLLDFLMEGAIQDVAEYVKINSEIQKAIESTGNGFGASALQERDKLVKAIYTASMDKNKGFFANIADDAEAYAEFMEIFNTDVGTSEWAEKLEVFVNKHELNWADLGLGNDFTAASAVFENYQIRLQSDIESVIAVNEKVNELFSKQEKGFSWDESQALMKEYEKAGGKLKNGWSSLFKVNEEGAIVLQDIGEVLNQLYQNEINTLQEHSTRNSAIKKLIEDNWTSDIQAGLEVALKGNIKDDNYARGMANALSKLLKLELKPDELDNLTTGIQSGAIDSYNSLLDFYTKLGYQINAANEAASKAYNVMLHENYFSEWGKKFDKGQSALSLATSADSYEDLKELFAPIDAAEIEKLNKSGQEAWDSYYETQFTTLSEHGASLDAFGNLVIKDWEKWGEYIAKTKGYTKNDDQRRQAIINEAKAAQFEALESYNNSLNEGFTSILSKWITTGEISFDDLKGVVDSLQARGALTADEYDSILKAYEEFTNGVSGSIEDVMNTIANAADGVDWDASEIYAAIEDAYISLIQTLANALKDGIDGALNATDFNMLSARYGLGQNDYIDTTTGRKLTQSGEVKTIAGMYRTAQASGSTTGLGTEVWEILKESGSQFQTYEDIAKAINAINDNAQAWADSMGVTMDQAKECLEVFEQIQTESRLDPDNPLFNFMEQDPTEGYGAGIDELLSNINKANEGLQTLKNKGSIAAKDFVNMFDFMYSQTGKSYEGDDIAWLNSLGITDQAIQTLNEKTNTTIKTYRDFVNAMVAYSGKLGEIDGKALLELGINIDAMADGMGDSLKQVAKDQIDFLKGIRNMLVAMKGIDGLDVNASIGITYYKETVNPDGSVTTERADMTLKDAADIAALGEQGLSGLTQADGTKITTKEFNDATNKELQNQLGNNFKTFFGNGFDLANETDAGMLSSIVAAQDKFKNLTQEQWQAISEGLVSSVDGVDVNNEDYQQKLLEKLQEFLKDPAGIEGLDLLEQSTVQLALGDIKITPAGDNRYIIDGEFDKEEVANKLKQQFLANGSTIEVTFDEEGACIIHYVNPQVKASIPDDADFITDDTGGTYVFTTDNGEVRVKATSGVLVDAEGNPLKAEDLDTLIANTGLNLEANTEGQVVIKTTGTTTQDTATLLAEIAANIQTITSLLSGEGAEISVTASEETAATLATLTSIVEHYNILAKALGLEISVTPKFASGNENIESEILSILNISSEGGVNTYAGSKINLTYLPGDGSSTTIQLDGIIPTEEGLDTSLTQGSWTGENGTWYKTIGDKTFKLSGDIDNLVLEVVNPATEEGIDTQLTAAQWTGSSEGGYNKELADAFSLGGKIQSFVLSVEGSVSEAELDAKLKAAGWAGSSTTGWTKVVGDQVFKLTGTVDNLILSAINAQTTEAATLLTEALGTPVNGSYYVGDGTASVKINCTSVLNPVEGEAGLLTSTGLKDLTGNGTYTVGANTDAAQAKIDALKGQTINLNINFGNGNSQGDTRFENKEIEDQINAIKRLKEDALGGNIFNENFVNDYEDMGEVASQLITLLGDYGDLLSKQDFDWIKNTAAELESELQTVQGEYPKAEEAVRNLQTTLAEFQDTTSLDPLLAFAQAFSGDQLMANLVALSNTFLAIATTDLSSVDLQPLKEQLITFSEIDFDASTIESITTLANLLASIPSPQIDTQTAIKNVDDLGDSIDNASGSLTSIPKNTTIDISVPNADGIAALATAINNLKTALDNFGNRTLSIRGQGSTTLTSVSGPADATGTAPSFTPDAHGLARGNFNYLLTGAALANGTLMGELGPELYVQDGMYKVAGANGPEFVDLHRDAIVFNHLQTASLLGKGHTTTHGSPVVSERRSVAMATGNLTGPAHANSSLDSAIAAIDAAIAMWQNILNVSAQQLANGGGGGGGGGGTAEAPTAELQEWYNLSREIARLEQEINNTLAKRKNLTNGREYLRSLKEQQAYLKDQLYTQKQLYDYQEKQLERQKNEINNNKVWSQFLIVDENGLRYRNGNETNGGKGALDILAALNDKKTVSAQFNQIWKYGFRYKDDKGNTVNSKSSEEDKAAAVQAFFDQLQGQIDAYDALYDTVQATEQAMAELEASINEIEQEILQNTMDLEEAIYDIIVENAERAIEKLEEYTEKLSEANEAYINGLKESLNAEKEQYEKEKSNEELSQLQRRLNLLRRTGGSATEIADLEKQLNEALKERYFNEQEKLIEELEKTNEEQIEKLEQQITIQQETLEYQKEAGLIWNEVAEIMSRSEQEVKNWFETNNFNLLSQSANQLAESIENFAHMIEMYKEYTEKWKPAHDKAQSDAEGKWEGEKGEDSEGRTTYTAGEVWNNSGNPELVSQLYGTLNDKQKESVQDIYSHTYADSITAGDDEETALRKATEAAEEMVNTFTGGTWKNNNTGKEKRYYYKFRLFNENNELLGTEVYQKMGDKDEKGNYKTTDKEALEKAVKYRIKEYYSQDADNPEKRKRNIEEAITNVGKHPNKDASDALKANYKKWYNAYKNTLENAYKVYYGYSQGGLVDYTGPAIVHGTPSKPEAFLNAKQTAMISDAVRAAGEGNVLDSIRATLANLDSSIRSLVTNNITTQSSNITVAPGAVVLNVAKLNDSYDIEELSNDIMNRMVNIASKATNRGVNRR